MNPMQHSRSIGGKSFDFVRCIRKRKTVRYLYRSGDGVPAYFTSLPDTQEPPHSTRRGFIAVAFFQLLYLFNVLFRR